MSSYPSISDPSHFETWIKNFKGTAGWVCSAKPQSEPEKQVVSETLQSISTIQVQRRSAATLELNLLYACYMASKALAPELDINSQVRNELAAERKCRPQTLKSIAILLDYIQHYRTTASKAIAQTYNSQKKAVHKPTNLSSQKLEALEEILADLEQGLMDFEVDPNHIALISSADFCYGPFEVNFDLNTELKRKATNQGEHGMHLNHTGLMFHLTYLFRYFTSNSLTDISALYRFFHGDILVLAGVRMIDGGRPYGGHVAALTNAVFKEQYSSSDVKDRLRALYACTPGSKTAKKAIFAGW